MIQFLPRLEKLMDDSMHIYSSASDVDDYATRLGESLLRCFEALRSFMG